MTDDRSLTVNAGSKNKIWTYLYRLNVSLNLQYEELEAGAGIKKCTGLPPPQRPQHETCGAAMVPLRVLPQR